MNLVIGEGLALRLPEESDGERWLELFRDPDNQRFGVPSFVAIPRTIEDLDGRVAEARREYAAREPTTFVIVAEDEPERFLGTVGWSFHVPPPLEVADVGYSVHPDARGRGVATRSLRILTRWLTDDSPGSPGSPGSDGAGDSNGPRLARVQLDHSVENSASCRTALAAGFEREGVRRAFLPLRDADAPGGARRHDVCLHGFVPEQPESRAVHPPLT